VIETERIDICFIPCTRRYGDYECWFDCTYNRYKEGGCVEDVVVKHNRNRPTFRAVELCFFSIKFMYDFSMK